MDKDKQKKRIKLFLVIIKFTVLIFIIIGIPLIIYLYNPHIIDNFRSLDNVNELLERHKIGSIFTYIGIQTFQIVVSVIPGQAIQFAAGYAYNFWLAYLFSIIGIGLGTLVTFYIAKFLGTDFIHLVFGEDRIQRYIKKLNSKKAFVILFILFLIPGVPKDMITYAAGVSEIRFLSFFIINLVGRTPALMGSILIGSFFRDNSWAGMYIMIGIAVVLFVLGIIYKNKVIEQIDKIYEKSVAN